MNMFQLAAALSSKKANKVEPDNFEMSKKSGTSSSNISSVDSRSQFFTFDENQPRYKICCGRVHVWRTAKIICILELLGTVALVLTLIVSFFVDIFHDFPISTKEMLIAWCILAVLASVLYFFGMRKLKSALMLPRLIVQVVNMAIDMLVVGYVSSLIATSKNVELVDNEDDDTVVNHVFLVIWIVIFVLQLLFFVILFLAYRYVRDWTVYLTYR